MANFHHKKKFTEDNHLNIPFWLKFVPRTFECVSLKSNNGLCNPIHGWVDWMRFKTEAPSRGKMGVERGSGN
jgi:hypothetical protein